MGAQSESKAVPRVSEFYLHDKGSEARVFQDGKIIIYTKKKKIISKLFFPQAHQSHKCMQNFAK